MECANKPQKNGAEVLDANSAASDLFVNIKMVEDFQASLRRAVHYGVSYKACACSASAFLLCLV